MQQASVFIPTYNGGKYIQSALQSVLSRKYADYEILIIDDGSMIAFGFSNGGSLSGVNGGYNPWMGGGTVLFAWEMYEFIQED
ncbi:glycosyltransferase family 2 protein [Dyadobacter frigoris]|uniref:Glycosyltransferase family 2 protein n=1 Tax=Dyadobacter frigoris TaxID=2576211 RepID=A0A4U6DBR9_9BACT|nr:glycosyltransferase [Dyadobacter frigoris]TKT91784.1 glycosyltransferase family 2 protein [Dyadobacter frigoris]GLU55568.1 hypothetical protein Dfri01_50290 [Dyadobacter frigoris]